ncbi:MAG: hypothetical protein KID07_05680 [Firmicutes bacterium]|nr:hypothetical protein [Bacillota bacterium]
MIKPTKGNKDKIFGKNVNTAKITPTIKKGGKTNIPKEIASKVFSIDPFNPLLIMMKISTMPEATIPISTGNTNI